MAANEGDTNADTCVLGPNFIMEGYSYLSAEVYPFGKDNYDPVVVPIGTGVTAYDCPVLRRPLLLVINEGLYYGMKMTHSLWNPNQIRSFGHKFQDNPFDDASLGITADGHFIPFQCKGTKVYVETRCPTSHELATCERVVLTPFEEWNPDQVVLGKVESSATATYIAGHPVSVATDHGDFPSDVPFHMYDDPTSDEAILHSISSSLVTSMESIVANVNLPYDRYSFLGALNIEEASADFVPARRMYVSHERHSKISVETLSERFLIGLPRARATLRATILSMEYALPFYPYLGDIETIEGMHNDGSWRNSPPIHSTPLRSHLMDTRHPRSIHTRLDLLPLMT